MAKPSLLFIHRSVGQHLLDDAAFYALVKDVGQPYRLSDYNQNVSLLCHDGAAPQHVQWQFPGNDTTPADYAHLFNEERPEAKYPLLSAILSYDIIAIKSCFPNTRIMSESMLAAHQRSYQQIIHFFQSRPDKKLAILTTPPLIPVLTLPPFANRARRLADWLSTTDFGPRIFVFDFFNELAIPEGKPQANTLRPEYRRPFVFDSHPNDYASKSIAPKLNEFFTAITKVQA